MGTTDDRRHAERKRAGCAEGHWRGVSRARPASEARELSNQSGFNAPTSLIATSPFTEPNATRRSCERSMRSPGPRQRSARRATAGWRGRSLWRSVAFASIPFAIEGRPPRPSLSTHAVEMLEATPTISGCCSPALRWRPFADSYTRSAARRHRQPGIRRRYSASRRIPLPEPRACRRRSG